MPSFSRCSLRILPSDLKSKVSAAFSRHAHNNHTQAHKQHNIQAAHKIIERVDIVDTRQTLRETHTETLYIVLLAVITKLKRKQGHNLNSTGTAICSFCHPGRKYQTRSNRQLSFWEFGS